MSEEHMNTNPDYEHRSPGADPASSAALRRSDLYGPQLTDGQLRPPTAWGRLLAWLTEFTASKPERARQEHERELARLARGLSRTTRVAVLSPKGGVGKTTCTLLAGDVLARHGRLRCVAVDANPDYGTLGSLAPDHQRSERTLADLLEHADHLGSPGELRPFVSVLDSGLHVLAAPARSQAMAELTDQHYRRLLNLLERFYELILLDLGTGLADPLARFALQVAHQAVVVCTPEWVTAERVLAALDDLQAIPAAEHLTLVLNQAPSTQAVDRQVLEAAFRRRHVARRVAIPYDQQLRRMLDAGAYQPEQLPHQTSLAVLQLGVAIAKELR
jgi:MinD-like ATPase involved in chromosome partitioning or flagellar assembly